MDHGQLFSHAEREGAVDTTWLARDQRFVIDQNARRVTPTRPRTDSRQSTRVVDCPRQPAVAPQMFNEQAWAQVAQSIGLSHRQVEIVQGVFRDDTESDIAAALGISPHTVHTHFERIYQKLGVTARTQLILRIVHEVLSHANLPGIALRPAPFLQPAVSSGTCSVAVS